MKKPETTIDTKKVYSLVDAAGILKDLSTSKFVGSVDIDILLNLSEKQKKETVSGSIVLPHKVGKDVRVAVIAEGEDQTKAKAAGADKVGFEELINEIANGTIDFDILIATPTVMRNMARLGKVLGPRGLMPNPRNETVTSNLEKAVASYKAGKLNFKSSEQLTVRSKVASVDMAPEKIVENVKVFLKAVFDEAKKLNAQPFKKITLSPTMGKGVRLDVNSLDLV